MEKAFVESALLTHGLASITNKELIKYWEGIETEIAWMEDGILQVGNIERFCEFRKTAAKYGRINYFNYDQSILEKQSGALTASGTMRACEEREIPLVITCGIGGLKEGQGKEKCNDILALEKSKVSMIATAPKDMFSILETIRGLREANVRVFGCQSEYCDGYLFVRNSHKLDGQWKQGRVEESTLYLNAIPEKKRFSDISLLEEAVGYGKKVSENGGLFHPAVNRKLDELTNGYTSVMQIESLIENIKMVTGL